MYIFSIYLSTYKEKEIYRYLYILKKKKVSLQHHFEKYPKNECEYLLSTNPLEN